FVFGFLYWCYNGSMSDGFWQKKVFFGNSLWPIFDNRHIFGFAFRRKTHKLVSWFCNNLIQNPKKGATLLEILVIIVIIAILTLIVAPNYKAGNSQLALSRSANKLSQDIRRAEEMAVSAKECQVCVPVAVPPSYGIYLEKDWENYILFADNGNGEYGGGDTQVERPNLESGVYIKDVNTPPKKVMILFEPPDPTIEIKWIIGGATQVEITLALKSDPTKTKKVYVNTVGLIYVQ
ncbi:MAG: prepilin-type N-terminal cleavage/methylation domain-containing protein, partial [bacterium]